MEKLNLSIDVTYDGIKWMKIIRSPTSIFQEKKWMAKNEGEEIDFNFKDKFQLSKI